MTAGVQMEILAGASSRACKRPNQIILMVLIAGRRSSLPGDKHAHALLLLSSFLLDGQGFKLHICRPPAHQ